MNNTNKFSVRKQLRSFKYAFNGIKLLIKTEHNMQIHVVAAITAILLSLLLHISCTEWCMVFLAIALVMSCEGVNTVIEKITDKIYPEYSEQAKFIKDVAAGAVLISAIGALIIGLIIFLPKIINLL
ncbi:MAG: diacylglycerol kinase family protein [Bacteroidota bacterium]|nr:diacylglycerol kinase family protein [Bacteroidota bacterium]MDP4226345.1 diacylglycerol kinase family protein [Bacteroidota bacterium]MDP4272792.1 diacylglycerol kinase family protein [Bacteroidota bacterium]